MCSVSDLAVTVIILALPPPRLVNSRILLLLGARGEGEGEQRVHARSPGGGVVVTVAPPVPGGFSSIFVPCDL